MRRRRAGLTGEEPRHGGGGATLRPRRPYLPSLCCGCCCGCDCGCASASGSACAGCCASRCGCACSSSSTSKVGKPSICIGLTPWLRRCDRRARRGKTDPSGGLEMRKRTAKAMRQDAPQAAQNASSSLATQTQPRSPPVSALARRGRGRCRSRRRRPPASGPRASSRSADSTRFQGSPTPS